MKIEILPDKPALGNAAAAWGAQAIRDALSDHGSANVILATGASQFEMLTALAAMEDIDWHRVTFFHLDEYIGLPIRHPASFRQYLWNRFVRHLPVPPAAFHYIDGEADPETECRRLAACIGGTRMDVAFIGIGENGHLAFNDPPADFEIEAPYLVVTLDEACRRQQLGEGWFPSLEAVPARAITMSVRQIMKSAVIVCTVPDQRKAEAVRRAVEEDLTPRLPASILRRHPDAALFLDPPAAAGLTAKPDLRT